MKFPEQLDQFGFGIEAEFLICDAVSLKPHWHDTLDFATLNSLIENIEIADLPALRYLELEAPHTKLSPFIVEGYHVPDPNFAPQDLLPKGIEIRTPFCDSIDECIGVLKLLFDRLQDQLGKNGLRAAIISHHPYATEFEGPQNKRRYDFWRWSMEAMLTYGPDINVSLPLDLRSKIDPRDLHAKANYYGPALAALTMASPFCSGQVWKIRGRKGKSLRTHRRSVYGQLLELHPEENGRMEFKPFEMTNRLDAFRAYILSWLALLLDDGLKGRASYQSRIYDLGNIAVHGVDSETVAPRATEVLERADQVLASHGFDPAALELFRDRLSKRRTPADDMIELFESSGSIEKVLERYCTLEESAPVEV